MFRQRLEVRGWVRETMLMKLESNERGCWSCRQARFVRRSARLLCRRHPAAHPLLLCLHLARWHRPVGCTSAFEALRRIQRCHCVTRCYTLLVHGSSVWFTVMITVPREENHRLWHPCWDSLVLNSLFFMMSYEYFCTHAVHSRLLWWRGISLLYLDFLHRAASLPLPISVSVSAAPK